MRKSYGFRTFHVTEITMYDALGKLPEPDVAQRFFDEAKKRMLHHGPPPVSVAGQSSVGPRGASATIRMVAVLPHPGMLPSGPSIASPECSRRHVSLSIDYTGSAAHAA